MRIDANSDGSIDWEEFMNYILLENETLSMMRAETCEYLNPKIPDPTSSMKTNTHRDMITDCLLVPNTESSEHWRYFTSSRDGTVKIWNANSMALMNTINVTKNWINSIAFLRNSDKLAVGTTDRQITFFDLQKTNEYMGIPCSRIANLKGCPMSMDSIMLNSKKEALLVGDDQGLLTMYRMWDNWHICDRTL
jgi:WD40 repeat protein